MAVVMCVINDCEGGKKTMTYQEVVQQAKTDIASRTDYGNNKITYITCELWKNGNQINLWTYWQGYQLKDIGKKELMFY